MGVFTGIVNTFAYSLVPAMMATNSKYHSYRSVLVGVVESGLAIGSFLGVLLGGVMYSSYGLAVFWIVPLSVAPLCLCLTGLLVQQVQPVSSVNPTTSTLLRPILEPHLMLLLVVVTIAATAEYLASILPYSLGRSL